MNQQRTVYLLEQYCRKALTTQETEELKVIVTAVEDESMLIDLLSNMMKDAAQQPYQVELSQLQASINRVVSIDKNIESESIDKVPATNGTSHKVWLRAAAVFILLVGGAYVWFGKPFTTDTYIAKAPSIPPGGNRATLTLSDGTIIQLDSVSDGNLAQQGSTQIIKLASGRVAYNGDARLAPGELTGYNTISTPKGGQYQIILSDGSQVWLNAASSIRFPTLFSEGNRKVEITGEAYLEIAKDINKPFFLQAGAASIEVEGVGLNINSYEDELAIRTTAVVGNMKVTLNKEPFLVKEGNQSVAEKDGSISIKEVDVKKETAWKDGLFQFAGADIKSVMRQLGRWYDVDIIYPGKIPGMKFRGEIQRDLNLEDVIEILKDSEVNLKLDGRKLIVMS